MTPFYINTVSLIGPGLADWSIAKAVLNDEQPYVPEAPGKYVPKLLRPNERRRTTPLIRIALQVAEQTLENSPLTADQLCSVFASSEGDIEIVDKICTSLTLPDQPVSPTQFHNSVHNAPAGYWAIATKSRMASSSISAGQYSFAAGLTEAACLALQDDQSVLLVSYDLPAPEPLKKFVNVQEPFACAILVTSSQTPASLCRVSARTEPGSDTTLVENTGLEQLRKSNPAAYSLPLLKALAGFCNDAAVSSQTVNLPFGDDESLALVCEPC